MPESGGNSQVPMKTVNAFPLSVFCAQIGFPGNESSPEQKKSGMIDQILAMRDATDPPQSPAAWTGDVRGFEFIHNEPTFKPLFDAFEGHDRALPGSHGAGHRSAEPLLHPFLGCLSPGQMNASTGMPTSSRTSAWSITCKNPELPGRIAFLHPSPPNEFVPGLFEAKMNSLFKGPRDEANSNNLIVDIQEGDLLIFPSRTEHATEPHDSTEPRISISADVMVTLKDSTEHEFLLPDPVHWRKMGD